MRVHASIDMAVRESRFASSLLQFWVTWFSGDVPHLLALIYKTRQQLARKCFLRTWWANARSCFDDTTFRGSWSHLVQDSNDGRRRKKKVQQKDAQRRLHNAAQPISVFLSMYHVKSRDARKCSVSGQVKYRSCVLIHAGHVKALDQALP